MLIKPRIIICVPTSVTDVECRAVVEAALSADARKVYLIDEPIAALLGAGIDISKPSGTMVVDIGGGTADVAVISFNGIVVSESIKVAGNKFDAAIVRYVSQKYKILIGEKTAEQVKIQLADVFEPDATKTMTIKGRHLVKGLPVSETITQVDVFEAVKELTTDIIDGVKKVFEKTPPELAGDIKQNGIVLTGGGALLGGLAPLISSIVRVPCYVADNPLECVALGTAAAFKLSEELLDGFERISLYRYK
ncbi:MAG: rod shape-determining protein MreB, partial [Ruminiclostridium sp.]|nr:rod shape-determining protein MreB [Ruminiclostridium sp.]